MERGEKTFLPQAERGERHIHHRVTEGTEKEDFAFAGISRQKQNDLAFRERKGYL